MRYGTTPPCFIPSSGCHLPGLLEGALMIVKLKQRIQSYLDEVIFEGSVHTYGLPPSKDATRRGMIKLHMAIIGLAGAAILVFLLIAALARPSFAAALWPYISAGLQLTWVKVIALAVLIGVGWLLFQVRENFRWFYGIGEVCVGIAACWVGLNSANTEGLASAIA